MESNRPEKILKPYAKTIWLDGQKFTLVPFRTAALEMAKYASKFIDYGIELELQVKELRKENDQLKNLLNQSK